MKSGLPVWLLITVSLITATSSEAQQPKQVPRIGFLSAVSASSQVPRITAFRDGLRELSYVEGANIIEWRSADGKINRMGELAAALVRLKVDLIVSAGPAVTRPAKATATIPIVMTFDDDPVGNGFVSSLARPGGNVTGLSSHSLEPRLGGGPTLSSCCRAPSSLLTADKLSNLRWRAGSRRYWPGQKMWKLVGS